MTKIRHKKKYTKSISIIIFIALVSILVFKSVMQKTFDATSLDASNAQQHIEELTLDTYQGRLAGTTENERALNYIKNQFQAYGINGGAKGGSYFQSFSMIVPDIDTTPIFTIPNQDKNTYQELIMYQDYVALPSFDGGSVDFDGELLMVGTNLLRVDPALIKDRVVVIEADVINPKWVEYVKKNEGQGIICCSETAAYGGNHQYERQKSIGIEGKTGETIFVGYISLERYQELVNLVGGELSKDKSNPSIINDVKIQIQIDYPIVETANIVGVLEGNKKTDRILLLTATVDGLGTGVEGQYFPGANNHISGAAGMLEIARVLSMQESLPYKTIVFIGFNGSLQQNAGAKYYIEHPIYPLDKTTVIHLDAIGQESIDGLTIFSENIVSKMLKDKMYNYAADANIFVNQGNYNGTIPGVFVNEGVPAIMVHDASKQPNTYEDTIEKINPKTLSSAMTMVINYIQHDIYKYNSIDYVSHSEWVVFWVIISILFFNMGLEFLYKRYPSKNILGQPIETHYYRLIFVLLRKILAIIIPVFLVSFMLTFLVNIHQNTDIKVINHEWVSNFSLYLTFKQSIVYLRTMFDFDVHQSYTVGNVFDVIYTSSVLSIKLISASLGLSVFIGIFRGMYEGYRTKKGGIRSLGTLVFFSIPDVLIVLLGVITYTYIAKNFKGLTTSLPLKDFIFPLITLSIIPTVYISRITFLTILDELDKEYVRAAKALGYSKIKIYMTEMLPAVIFKVVDSLPTIMTMLLSNMIIVEYLFNYNGIVYYLLYLYKRNDVYRFVPMALTLGLIYSCFVYGIGLLTKVINPLKREGRK